MGLVPEHQTDEALVAALDAIRTRPDTYLVAVAGIPGSGKTTFCRQLAAALHGSAVIPMDGYHLPLARLGAADLARRGAPHTFDPAALRGDLERLRCQRHGLFPAFDHAKKDPEPDAIHVTEAHRVVIVEGLYLLLGEWSLTHLFDLTLFIDCTEEVAAERLIRRHLQTGLSASEEEARQRVQGNDLLNARLILADGCRDRAMMVI